MIKLFAQNDSKLKKKAKAYGYICITAGLFMLILAFIFHFLTAKTMEQITHTAESSILMLKTSPELQDLNSNAIQKAITVMNTLLEMSKKIRPLMVRMIVFLGLLLFPQGFLYFKLHKCLNKES